MKFVFCLLFVILVAVSATFFEDADALFETFKSTYGRVYSSEEEHTKRRAIFRETMKRVDRDNEINGSPVFGVTKFSDWTVDEFSVLLGRKGRGYYNPKRITNVRNPATPEKWGSKNARKFTSLPMYVNWEAEGMLTPIKNQGQCGSCWAFATAEQIESEWLFQGNSPWQFSPQQVASCTTSCDGCGGGSQTEAYEYLETVVGLGSEWFAPYTQSMYKTCETSKCTTACSTFDMTTLAQNTSLTGPYGAVKSYSYATPMCTDACTNQDTTLLATNLATYGPVSIDVNAANWASYVGGVLSQTACGGYSYDDLDHAVQLTGYNAQASTPYWIVRNSWATNWGNSGFIYLQYPLNTCGLANAATMVELSNA